VARIDISIKKSSFNGNKVNLVVDDALVWWPFSL